MADNKTTLSVFTAGAGGFVGGVSSHPEVVDSARETLVSARSKGAITDCHVLRCGSDLGLVLAHHGGALNPEVHALADKAFSSCAEVARDLKLFNAPRAPEGAPPGAAECEFAERESEPVVVFFACGTGRGSWNLPVCRIFADPFNTPGLTSDAAMLDGFTFTLVDTADGAAVELNTPEDTYTLIALASASSRFTIASVASRRAAEPAAVVSGPPRGPDGRSRNGSALVVRCQGGLPEVGEVMEAFSYAHLVQGPSGLPHGAPLMPVPFYEANPVRLDGPPRAISAGFQVTDGRLIGPHDMFDDPGFDEARRSASALTDHLRRQGPFQAHGPAELTLAASMDRVRDRFKRP